MTSEKICDCGGKLILDKDWCDGFSDVYCCEDCKWYFSFKKKKKGEL